MTRSVALLLALVLLVAACDREEASPTTATTVLPSATEILAGAADTMQAVESLRYAIELSGAPITLLGVELRSARGVYASPDASEAVLEAAIGGLTIELATIAIGPTSWLTNPLSGEWDEYTGSRAFNPAIIFDPELGWRPLLTTDVSDARLVEPVGDERYVVEGTAAGARVEVLTAGLVEAQPVDVRFDIDRESLLVTRMEFTTLGEAGESIWVLELSDFDEPVSISPPEVG